jgi:hypothetical protein
MHRAANALGRNHPPRPGAFACLEPQVALLRQIRGETLAPYHASRGEQMLTRIGELVHLAMAWRQRRRARQAADPLLMPDPERAPARAILAYYNQVGDPSL